MRSSIFNLYLILVVSATLVACFLARETRAAPSPQEANKDEKVLDWIKKDDQDEESSEEESTRDDICKICGKDFSEFEHLTLLCGHKFHQACLYGWIHPHNEGFARGCPTCTAEALDESWKPPSSYFHNFNERFVTNIKQKWGVMARYSGDMFKLKDNVENHQMT